MKQMRQMYNFIIDNGTLISSHYEGTTYQKNTIGSTEYTTNWYRLFNQYDFIIMVRLSGSWSTTILSLKLAR